MKPLKLCISLVLSVAITSHFCLAQEQDLIKELRAPKTGLLDAQRILHKATEMHSIAVVVAALDCDDGEIWIAALDAAMKFPRSQQIVSVKAALASERVWREQKGGEMGAIQGAFSTKLIAVIRELLNNGSLQANLMVPKERVTVASLLQ
jgi:hypothetical protein